MRILCNGAYAPIMALARHSDYASRLGWLNTPRTKLCWSRLLASSLPIAADNSAYSAWCPRRFRHFVRSIPEGRLLWLAVPDVVGSSAGTQARFDYWYPQLSQHPLAYVAQDHSESDATIPWNLIVALFIGGSTQWK